MAALARRNLRVVRGPRRASPQIAKLKERLKSASRRARAGGGSGGTDKTIFTLVGASLLAFAEAKKVELPTVAKIDPALLYGGIGALVLPRFVGGKNGARLQAVGDGLLAVAAHRSIKRGGIKVEGVEIGADDDDDDLS
jgi:hypothetical protein